MRFFQWKNKRITNSNLFVQMNEDELMDLSSLFPEIQECCVSFDGFYVFIDMARKTIIPLRNPSFAFGGLYNGNMPYGEELKDITVDFKKLRWEPYTEFENEKMNLIDGQDRIVYTEEKMDAIKKKVQRLIEIVKELEDDFPGRHFTLDGHLVGSIGEVMASYYYGIELYSASAVAHDGEIDGKKIQIKITQQEDIVINHEPEYLIALYLNKSGDVYEIYNGPGKEPWNSASKRDSHNNRHMRVNKLMEMDKQVSDDSRIKALHDIEKMKLEYKNKKSRSKS